MVIRLLAILGIAAAANESNTSSNISVNGSSNSSTCVNASETDRQWCCQQLGLACESNSSEHCTGDLSESKSAWCCAHEHVACPSNATKSSTPQGNESYDCKPGNLSDFIRQSEWCCEHEGAVCNASSFCLGEMTSEERAFCCKHGVCDIQYDCSHADNWKSEWTEARAVWCCKHRQVACKDPTFDCSKGLMEDWTGQKRSYCCREGRCESTTSSGVLGHVADANCHEDDRDWAPEKRAWCCRTEHLGCEAHEDDIFDCRAAGPSWTPAQRAWCCIKKHVGCPSTTTHTSTSLASSSFEPFNCQADPPEDWSQRKQAWCCSNKQLGCAPYKCDEDVVEEWSAQKQSWCCRNKGVGCPATRTSLPFDCHQGVSDQWSAAKMQWCCFNLKIGCPEFDCEDGYSNWKLGFSTAKKRWCCEHYRMACESAGPEVQEMRCWGDPEEWPRDKQQWCCLVEKRGCLSDLEKELDEPYACDSDDSRAWSREKSAWCCFEKGIGCEMDPYAGYSVTGWPESDKEDSDPSFYFMLGLCAVLLVITYLRNKGSICGDGHRSYHHGRSPSTTYGRGSYSALGSRYSPPTLPT